MARTPLAHALALPAVAHAGRKLALDRRGIC